MQIERADIDGFSNRIYIYSNRDVIIENYQSKIHQKAKLDEEINLEQVYDYIDNYMKKTNTDYKIVLNSALHKENKVVFISSEDEEIKALIEDLNGYMKQNK